MEILGYLASLVIGVSLGLIGGGGSILTVPVLVYLMGVAPVQATAYSLFIVGATSLVGAYPKFRQGLVDLRTALVFGAPSILAVYATRRYIVPAIPEDVMTVGGFTVTKPVLTMLLFAVLMVAASLSMIRDPRNLGGGKEGEGRVFNYPLILLEGAVVGVLTGLVGAGGGFLIIPALVLLSRLPMKMAVGTSLIIIAAKSLIGFMGDLSTRSMEWSLLIPVTALSIAGLFVGDRLSKSVDGNSLKKGFGWFVLVMGVYIILQQVFFPLR
jgi:uncharacterized membrane protein YfcA